MLAVLAVLAACDAGRPAVDVPTVDVVQVVDVSLRPAEKIDLLILMDDTVGLVEVQANLAGHLPAFLAQLASATGSLPSLHVGLTTSDMGATGSNAPDSPAAPLGQQGNGGCIGMGRDGALLTSGAMVNGTFLTDANYTGDLAAVLGAMLRAGGGGCGFEQHLRGIERALTKQENASFLRPDAALAVLLVADEDDCSVRDARLFDPNAADLGPQQSYRCTVGGIRCNESLDSPGTKTGCEPSESREVRSIQPTIDLLETLRPRDRLVVAGIVGDPSPLAVELHAPPTGTTPINALSNVCGMRALSGAVHVGVRLDAFLTHFEAHGSRSTICGTDLRDSFLDAARAFEQLLGVGCIDTRRLADASTTEGVQASCEAFVVHDGEREAVPMCPVDGACVELVPDDPACGPAPYVRALLRDASVTEGQLQVYCELPHAPT